MTNDEYGQLVEFLGRKFAEVDRSFDQTATKDEVQAQQTETRRHFDVVGENLRSQIQLLAEGHQGFVEGQQALLGRHQALVEGQERILERVESLERELGAMIRISYAQLDDRVRNCERGLAAVQERLTRVESRQA